MGENFYVILIVVEVSKEKENLNKIKKYLNSLSVRYEAHLVYGVYDIVVILWDISKDKFEQILDNLRRMSYNRSTIGLVGYD